MTKEEKPKHKKLKIIILTITTILVLFFIYVYFIEPKRVIVKEIPVTDEKLPQEFNGFKVVQFSDIHYGNAINEKELDNIVNKINKLKPDILVYTGDLLDDAIILQEDSYIKIKEKLSKLEAKFRKYAVIGDSDYVNKEKYVEIMTESGFTVLENSHDYIYYKGNNPIVVIGTSSILEQENNIELAATLEDNASYFQIWLNHEPMIFDSILDQGYRPNLLLTGHTLGGLIHIPYYGPLIIQKDAAMYKDDYYHKKRVNMYVSNGLGTYKYNVRFLNTPSISLYRLYNS